eukprot:gene10488-1906_t
MGNVLYACNRNSCIRGGFLVIIVRRSLKWTPFRPSSVRPMSTKVSGTGDNTSFGHCFNSFDSDIMEATDVCDSPHGAASQLSRSTTPPTPTSAATAAPICTCSRSRSSTPVLQPSSAGSGLGNSKAFSSSIANLKGLLKGTGKGAAPLEDSPLDSPDPLKATI